MSVESDCAEFVSDAIADAVQYDSEDVAEYYKEHPPANPTQLLELVTAFLPDPDNGGPLVWDAAYETEFVSNWITKEAAKCSAQLTESDRNSGTATLRMPWEMLFELIYHAGDIDVLKNSGGWIWSPAGPPINTNKADLTAFSANVNLDDEKQWQEIQDKIAKKANERSYRHAQMLGTQLDLENLETLLQLHSDSATAQCEDLFEVESIADTKAIESVERFHMAQPGTAERRMAMWAASINLRDVALTILYRAQHVWTISAIAEGDTIESVGWDWIAGHARLNSLMQMWQQAQPCPDQTWWKPFAAHYPLQYWQLRITAASLEEHRAIDGEEGFLEALGTHPLLNYL